MPFDRAVVGALLKLAAIDKGDWNSALQQILRVDADVVGVGRVSYWSRRRVPSALVCEMGFIAATRSYERGMVLEEPEVPAYFVAIRDENVLAVEDAQHDARTAELGSYLTARRISSMLDIPVWVAGQVAGVLCHEHVGEGRAWSEPDIEFAVAISQVISLTLESRRRSHAEKDARRASMLDEASRRFFETLEVEGVGKRAIEFLVPKLGDWAVIDLIEPGDRVRRVARGASDAEKLAGLDELDRRYQSTLDGDAATVRAIRLGGSLLMPEIAHDRLAGYPERIRQVAELGPRSAMIVPLQVGDRSIGALGVAAAQPRRYGPDDLGFLEELGERLALALENAGLHRQAQEAIRARDVFISMASHEIHGPLASLQLAAEALPAANPAPEPWARLVDVIRRQVGRLSRLVDQMLDATRIGEGRLTLAPVAGTDLGLLVRETVAGLADWLARAKCTVHLEVPLGVTGNWDPQRLRQVITSLLDNAMKFGPGKPIDVRVYGEGASAALAVHDHGIGIDDARLPFIFYPFERAVSPRHFGGLGLGLYIARAIVDKHGGTITIASRNGEGATVTVTLPVAGGSS